MESNRKVETEVRTVNNLIKKINSNGNHFRFNVQLIVWYKLTISICESDIIKTVRMILHLIRMCPANVFRFDIDFICHFISIVIVEYINCINSSSEKKMYGIHLSLAASSTVCLLLDQYFCQTKTKCDISIELSYMRPPSILQFS